jgi:hypothetical protein
MDRIVQPGYFNFDFSSQSDTLTLPTLLKCFQSESANPNVNTA